MLWLVKPANVALKILKVSSIGTDEQPEIKIARGMKAFLIIQVTSMHE